MKNKKRLFISFSVLLVLGVVYFLVQSKEKPTSWQTFNKVNHQYIDSYPTTPQEVEENQLPKISQKKVKAKKSAPRQPASLGSRTWELRGDQKVPHRTVFLNEPRDDWKELAGQEILRFLRPDTKLFIKKEASLTLLEDRKGRHVERVLIKIKSPEGRHYSYNAFIDSESGKVLQTWNSTIHEPVEREPAGMRPTGGLLKDGSAIQY